MMELLRILSTEAKPLKHDVIFLFNGAEENILQVRIEIDMLLLLVIIIWP